MATKVLQIVGELDTRSVKYTEQYLTESQKAQARENIGVSDIQGDYEALSNMDIENILNKFQ